MGWATDLSKGMSMIESGAMLQGTHPHDTILYGLMNKGSGWRLYGRHPSTVPTRRVFGKINVQARLQEHLKATWLHSDPAPALVCPFNEYLLSVPIT